jgi:hypothetical protein
MPWTQYKIPYLEAVDLLTLNITASKNELTSYIINWRIFVYSGNSGDSKGWGEEEKSGARESWEGRSGDRKRNDGGEWRQKVAMGTETEKGDGEERGVDRKELMTKRTEIRMDADKR